MRAITLSIQLSAAHSPLHAIDHADQSRSRRSSRRGSQLITTQRNNKLADDKPRYNNKRHLPATLVHKGRCGCGRCRHGSRPATSSAGLWSLPSVLLNKQLYGVLKAPLRRADPAASRKALGSKVVGRFLVMER